MNYKQKLVLMFIAGIIAGFIIGFMIGVSITINEGMKMAGKLLNVTLNQDAMGKLITHFPQINFILD